MTEDIATPSKIWIITGESYVRETSTGARSSSDTGGQIGGKERSPEVAATERSQVDVSKLKLEMQGFLKAMREMLDEADPPSAKIRLDEVELSVEINGEGQVSLFGVGGKAGGKGAMTFKFKRKDG